MVACLTRDGSTKLHPKLLIEKFFAWARSRGITSPAAHVKGTQYVEAVSLSRLKNVDNEWMLHPLIFQWLCDVF